MRHVLAEAQIWYMMGTFSTTYITQVDFSNLDKDICVVCCCNLVCNKAGSCWAQAIAAKKPNLCSSMPFIR